jgi:hypothetical protein
MTTLAQHQQFSPLANDVHPSGKQYPPPTRIADALCTLASRAFQLA